MKNFVVPFQLLSVLVCLQESGEGTSHRCQGKQQQLQVKRCRQLLDVRSETGIHSRCNSPKVESWVCNQM